MASIKKTPVSSIAMALAGKTASVNIPKPAEVGSKKKGLPTPPNSISPTLPPQVRDEHDLLTPPGQGSDSDIDLQDAVEHAQAQGGGFDKSAIDATGTITPTLLAIHHLPEILLEHGPLAIRHIMGYLMVAVPGFSAISPNKARRVVVAALEGRGGEAHGGLNGEVIFEKVGWGRWDARHPGQPSQRSRHTSPVAARHAQAIRSPSPYSTSHPRSSFGTSFSKPLHLPHRPRHRRPSAISRPYSGRYETEADGMSMGNDSGGSSSEAEDSWQGDDDGDATDEEDWATIGAAALRAGFSLPKVKGPKVDYNARSRKLSTQLFAIKRPTPSISIAKSAPALTEEQIQNLMRGVGKDESEAAKALLQLGSM